MIRKKHKKKPQAVRLGDGPTMERRKQLGGTVEEVIDQNFHGNLLVMRHHASYECMLDAYLINELISKPEYEAGMRFRLAWLRAVEGIRVEDRMGAGGGMGTEEWLNTVFKNERYLREALSFVTEAQKSIVMRVCVDDRRAGGSYALETLHRGLENMAKGWGMAAE